MGDRDAPASREQQYYLASLMRPLLAQDDMVSVNQVFKVFGQVCTDTLPRHAINDIRADYQVRQDGMLYARTTPFREGDPFSDVDH